MSRTIVLGIDAGTTGVRTFAIDDRSSVVRSAYREFTQHFPRPGWVEHDAEEIWAAVAATIANTFGSARRSRVGRIGPCNRGLALACIRFD